MIADYMTNVINAVSIQGMKVGYIVKVIQVGLCARHERRLHCQGHTGGSLCKACKYLTLSRSFRGLSVQGMRVGYVPRVSKACEWVTRSHKVISRGYEGRINAREYVVQDWHEGK
jgi:hypothetical protein